MASVAEIQEAGQAEVAVIPVAGAQAVAEIQEDGAHPAEAVAETQEAGVVQLQHQQQHHQVAGERQLPLHLTLVDGDHLQQ